MSTRRLSIEIEIFFFHLLCWRLKMREFWNLIRLTEETNWGLVLYNFAITRRVWHELPLKKLNLIELLDCGVMADCLGSCIFSGTERAISWNWVGKQFLFYLTRWSLIEKSCKTRMWQLHQCCFSGLIPPKWLIDFHLINIIYLSSLKL